MKSHHGQTIFKKLLAKNVFTYLSLKGFHWTSYIHVVSMNVFCCFNFPEDVSYFSFYVFWSLLNS